MSLRGKALQGEELGGFSPPDANDAGLGVDLRFWYAVDFPDNGINTTPPESFSSLNDHGAINANVTQGTKDQQPLRTLNNGRLAASFDNTNDLLESVAASSAYRFLHDGAGTTIFCAARRTQADPFGHTILSTLRINDTRTGIDILQSSGEYSVRVGNSSGTYVIDTSPAGTFPENGISQTFVFRWDSSSFNMRVNGVSVVSGAPVGAPAAGNPFRTMSVGALAGGGGSVFRGDLLEIGAYTGLLSDSVVASLESYLARWKG